MKKTLAVLAFACVAFAAPLFAADPAPAHGLMTIDSAWTKAMIANDPAACAALYAEDAVLILPGSGKITGRKAIAAAYAAWFEQVKVLDATISDAHYESGGNVSCGWGAWSVKSVPRAGGDTITESGRWTAVAVKQNGVWVYASDHASADPVAVK
jgi:uncharacterized protein (TIGR02246 family)